MRNVKSQYAMIIMHVLGSCKHGNEFPKCREFLD
jgi:hypothetical protein